MKQFFTIFVTILIAEIGDKTQLATMLFATENRAGRLGIFAASAAALVTASAIAVLAGGVISRFVPEATLRIAAGIGFILVGIWTLISSR
jgi:putative Ca2+/H+ antiporter (TMEM165/GDT1 family)